MYRRRGFDPSHISTLQQLMLLRYGFVRLNHVTERREHINRKQLFGVNGIVFVGCESYREEEYLESSGALDGGEM
ncbi:hypothetical protein TorRG33x02_155320 [Trema orientale]|uniref:Uncharacterized protein n=1 Tax=Trema orientale TaxID=63057 RepID=A0A2P5ESW3_TREOI|nr:hypothetical protein TorRG33x02_155320 [Trema orientale]